MANYTNFFTDTDVPTFRVPQRLIGDSQEDGMLSVISHPALRLYLAILCTCGRKNKPIVKMTSAYIERHADISEKKVSKVREELEDAFLIRTTKDKGGYLYEVLDPYSSGLPLLMPARTEDKTFTDNRGRLDLSPDQIEKVFVHYLKDSQLYDDANGLRFLCPFHVNIGKDRRFHLSVGMERGGPWMCHLPECKHHGSRRKRDVWKDGSWHDSKQVGGYDGGGNTLDFIVAMVEKQDGKIIDRKEAEGIMTSILTPKMGAIRG